MLNTQKAQISAQGMQAKNQMAQAAMAQKAQDNAMNRQQKDAQFNLKMRQPQNPRGGP